ncbi:acyltransferase family protein [Virgibacillus litoralis]|uniref:Surface polysaccharide O-acyltransferase-like enzyme n=1 Tax=Virgibacillus litoralis TaxID=578221 RepID=A0ABS4HDN2_9BACI|nr:surface polysaccharide O-acyltransferase-like enzyme [Virgibacillus litoralis]
MEFSKRDMKMLQGVAILFMLSLHLFARKDINGLYETYPMINDIPLIYYIGLFGDACVPIYLFVSGYGLSISLAKGNVLNKNIKRILKLLINFWIILFLFMGIGFLIGKMEAFPGGISQFLLNFSLLSNSYNGAWWYLQTYVLLVIMAAPLIKLVKRNNTIIVLMVSGFIYLITYIQRIKFVIEFDSTILTMLNNATVLLGTSQLAFIIGIIFAKEQIYSKLNNTFNDIKFKNTLCVLGVIILVIFHGIFETMFVAPFTAILFICIFCLMDKKESVQKGFAFFGRHSLNIWLTHMFFYISFFKVAIFAPYYPILIFSWLVLLCLVTSFVINSINNPLARVIDKQFMKLPLNHNYRRRKVS